MKAESMAHEKPTSSTSGSATIPSPSASPPVGSMELSTDAEVNKQQPEAANSNSDADAHISTTMDDQSEGGDTNPKYDNVSFQDSSPNSVASDSEGDFESAVEDGNENNHDDGVKFFSCIDNNNTDSLYRHD
jgi:hypothetical protein